MLFLRLTSVFCVVLWLSLTNCGSSGDDSSPGDIIVNGDVVDCVDPATLTNGADLYSYDGSYWYCVTSAEIFVSFLYDDGTGGTIYPDGSVWPYTWYESDCNELTYIDADGTSRLTAISGSVDSRIFTFRAENDDGTSTNASCVLEYI